MTNDFDEMLKSLPKAGQKKRKNPESLIQREITQALQLRGLWVVRVAGQGTIQMGKGGLGFLKKSEMAGFPDLLILGPEGLTAWLEVKAPQGRLSPLQRARHERMEALSHVVAVVRSPDEAINVLDANGWFAPSLYVTNESLLHE